MPRARLLGREGKRRGRASGSGAPHCAPPWTPRASSPSSSSAARRWTPRASWPSSSSPQGGGRAPRRAARRAPALRRPRQVRHGRRLRGLPRGPARREVPHRPGLGLRAHPGGGGARAGRPGLGDRGRLRHQVPQAARDRARGMAAEWKEAAERKGGVEGAKPPDGHAFLQHVATFAVAEKEDRELYKRIVLTFSWRRQMPRLALTLGLEDDMEDIIEELITKGQQLDAVNFAYEAGHLEKFSPVPLLKTYLEDSKKIYCAPDNLSTGSGQSGVAKSSGLALASDLSANDSTADYQSAKLMPVGYGIKKLV